LTRQRSVADAEKLAGALMDAQVDLKPHQVLLVCRREWCHAVVHQGPRI
jgi:hypothetical protein